MGVKKQKKKGKRKPKNNATSKKYSKYKVEGDKVTKTAKFCPRCGPGVFLMNSQGRTYCGKCHYAEFEGKPKEAPKEEKSEEKK